MIVIWPGFSLSLSAKGINGVSWLFFTMRMSDFLIYALPEFETNNIPAQPDHPPWSSDLCVNDLCSKIIKFVLQRQIFTSMKALQKIVLCFEDNSTGKLKEF